MFSIILNILRQFFKHFNQSRHFSHKNLIKSETLFCQGFGRENDENRADLYLRSIVFSFESGRL